MPKTSEIQVDPEIALAMMRMEREDHEQVNGTFYLVGHRPTQPQMMVIVPCVEHPAITATLIPKMAGAEGMIIDSVAMVMDTYRYLDSVPLAEGVDLAVLFAEGDPRVSEALVAACVEKDGPGWYFSQTYIALDGVVVWGDVVDIDRDSVDGFAEGERAHWRTLRRELEGLLR